MAVDPMVHNSSVVTTVSFEKAVLEADVIVILVAHTAFKDPSNLALLKGRNVFDCCGLLSLEK